jgi:hypothetical protein
MSDDIVTLRVRGEGGAEFDMDVPPDGSPRREVFDEMVRKGLLVVLEGEIPGAGPDSEPVDALEDLKVDELKGLADERGVDLDGATKKADIIDAIRAAESDDEDDDPS